MLCQAPDGDLQLGPLVLQRLDDRPQVGPLAREGLDVICMYVMLCVL